jgi:hypothetical protein
MFVSKKYLSRRTMLRGLGTAVALPFLDAMVPASTALAQTAAAPQPKLGFIYFPHGAIMANWTPATEGRDFALSPILKPLEKYQRMLTVVSGLENKPAISPAVHAITPGTWLSAVAPRISHSPYGGVSIDQIAVPYIGQDTPLPSLEVATEPRGGGGVCDRSYGCSYGATISFRTPSQPLPMEYNPQKLFYTLFGQGDSADERAKINWQHRSMLDQVMAEAATLQKQLGAADATRVSDYLESVREIERRVQMLESRDVSHLDLPDVPIGVLPSFDQQLKLQFDLMALAYEAGLTRIVSMMMAAEVSNMTYNHIGVRDAFHPLSHHKEDPEKMERMTMIQTYHTQMFARFLDRLANIPDGENSVLDNAIILYGSNMSNSDKHDNWPLPSALVGGGAGRLKGNQHLKYPDRTPLANLLLTVLDRAGVPVDRVGDSTGVFTEV